MNYWGGNFFRSFLKLALKGPTIFSFRRKSAQKAEMFCLVVISSFCYELEVWGGWAGGCRGRRAVWGVHLGRTDPDQGHNPPTGGTRRSVEIGIGLMTVIRNKRKKEGIDNSFLLPIVWWCLVYVSSAELFSTLISGMHLYERSLDFCIIVDMICPFFHGQVQGSRHTAARDT